MSKIAVYEQVKNHDPDKVVVVDVREISELQQHGIIPNSIHIPLGQVEDAFKTLTPEEFKRRFGREKPDASMEIIFSCKAGVRSGKALKMLENCGYTNLRNYQGGFDDFAANNKTA